MLAKTRLEHSDQEVCLVRKDSSQKLWWRIEWADSNMDKGNDLYDESLRQQCTVPYKVGFELIKFEGTLVTNQPNMNQGS